MKTILFIDKGEKAIWGSFQRNAYLVDEYRRRGLFEICDWHPAGMSVRTAVPTVHSLLDGEDEWCAIVACDLRHDNPPATEDPHFDNPFDFPDSYRRDPDAAVEESEHAVVRLAQMLGGLPTKLRTRPHERREAGKAFVSYEIHEERGESYFDMERRYNLGIARPSRIVIVSPRDFDGDLYRARADELRSEGMEVVGRSGLSDRNFWERNCYPDSARFVVCDRSLPSVDDGEDLRLDKEQGKLVHAYDAARERSFWSKYWLCMLTLMTAELRPDQLRPYRLYSVDVDVDQVLLRRQLDDRYTSWTVARRKVAEQIELEAGRTRRAVASSAPASYEASIEARFELGSRASLHADPSQFAFVQRNNPTDLAEWDSQGSAIRAGFRKLLAAPRRSVRTAVEAFGRSRMLTREELDANMLGERERFDLEEDLDELEFQMARETGPVVFPIVGYQDQLGQRCDAIDERMRARPKRSLISGIVASLVAGLAIGFLPQLANLAAGKGIASGIVPLVAAYVAVVAVVLLVALFWQWYGIVSPLIALNDWLEPAYDRLEADRQRTSRRLSQYATFCRGWAIRDHQPKVGGGLPTARAEELAKTSAMLKTRMDSIQGILGRRELDGPLALEMTQQPWGSIVELLDDPWFVSLAPESVAMRPLNEGQSDAPAMVRVPFGFVSGVSVEMLKVISEGART